MLLWETDVIILTTFFTILMQSMYGLSDVRTSCRTVPGLTKQQLELCYRAKDVTAAALDGLELAIKECQLQWHRWNCSALNSKRRNPHSSNLLKKGYKETAFAYAISAAGVAHNIARACSLGHLISCGCDPSVTRKSLTKYLHESLHNGDKKKKYEIKDNKILNEFELKKLERSKATSRWKWGGCSHNMDFGIEFSGLFLDSREKAGDIQSKINLHNNHAGRMAVANNMQIRCKCHGMSGSCQLKTCWKSAPEFRIVGKVLKQQFRKAVLVDQSNMGNGSPLIVNKKSRKKKLKYRNGRRPPRKIINNKNNYINDNNNNKNNNNNNNNHDIINIIKNNNYNYNNIRINNLKYHNYAVFSLQTLENSLFYYQRSPNFCDKDPTSDIPGTIGRKCNRTNGGSSGCASMCCGRGYNLIKERRVERCYCKFHWCCYVECQSCEIEEWVSVCN